MVELVAINPLTVYGVCIRNWQLEIFCPDLRGGDAEQFLESEQFVFHAQFSNLFAEDDYRNCVSRNNDNTEWHLTPWQ